MANPLAGKPLNERLSEAELNDPGFLRSALAAGHKIIEEGRAKLADDERMLKEVKERLHFLYHGVAPGVLVRKVMSGEVYKVQRISTYADPDINQQPSLDGYKQRKDGTFGVRSCHIWGRWELVKPCNTSSE